MYFSFKYCSCCEILIIYHKEIYIKKGELNSKYGNENCEFDEELTEHLKNKFPEQYKLSIEDLKNDGSDDPETEMTPGRFIDHIGDKGEEFLKEYEACLKKLLEKWL